MYFIYGHKLHYKNQNLVCSIYLKVSENEDKNTTILLKLSNDHSIFSKMLVKSF